MIHILDSNNFSSYRRLSLKILFIQPYFAFPEIIYDTLPGQLARKGYRIEVISYAREREKASLFSQRGNIHFHFANALSISIPSLVTEFPYFLYLEKMVKEIKPDIIHINNLPFLTTLQSVKIAKKMHIPSLIHVHGVFAKRNSILETLQKIYLRSAGPFIFKEATITLCLTKGDAQEVLNYGCLRDKIVIIPNGVDVDMFKPDNTKEENGLIMWLGRFVPEKGLTYLLKAIKILCKRPTKNIKVLLIGDGLLKTKIKLLVHKYGLKEIVNIIPAVTHNLIPEYLNRASIIVLPSIKEGMPYILLEAMACGKPVIASNISGPSDVITDGENGILIPPKNPEALADAILTLINNKSLRRKLGQNARRLMVEKYNWDIIIKKVERVYLEITGETGKV